MSAPTTSTDANGHLVEAGNAAQLVGVVQSVDGSGNATITLSDAYGVAGVSVTVPCYNIRQQKIKSAS